MLVNNYERNKLDVSIYTDDDPESPRTWDNIGTMICSNHRSYNLGDEQFDSDDYDGWADLEKHLREERDAVVVLPLGLYDHSGITMYVGSVHDRWDGGQVGFIYATAEDLKKEYPGDNGLNSMEAYLRAEVKTYDQYLRGEVYGFTVQNPRTGEEIDSCWGFYGVEAAEEEANSMAYYYKHPAEAAYAKKASELHG